MFFPRTGAAEIQLRWFGSSGHARILITGSEPPLVRGPLPFGGRLAPLVPVVPAVPAVVPLVVVVTPLAVMVVVMVVAVVVVTTARLVRREYFGNSHCGFFLPLSGVGIVPRPSPRVLHRCAPPRGFTFGQLVRKAVSVSGAVPIPGRIVLYTLDAYDADAINRRRAYAWEDLPDHRARPDGAQLHVGDGVKAG